MNNQAIWSLVRTLLTIIGGVMVDHHLASAPDVTQASTDLMTILPATVSLGSFLFGVYAHWNMKKVPADSIAVQPSIPSDAPPKGQTAQVIGKVVGAILLAFVIMSPHHADAQTKLTGNIVNDIKSATAAPTVATSTEDFGTQFRKLTKDLIDKAISDVQAASADADKHGDVIAKPCWDANLKFLQMLPSEWETPPAVVGVALGIQVQRDLLNSITGNDATSLKVACAALWGDQLKIVANVGALLGIRIATGGLL